MPLNVSRDGWQAAGIATPSSDAIKNHTPGRWASRPRSSRLKRSGSFKRCDLCFAGGVGLVNDLCTWCQRIGRTPHTQLFNMLDKDKGGSLSVAEVMRGEWRRAPHAAAAASCCGFRQGKQTTCWCSTNPRRPDLGADEAAGHPGQPAGGPEDGRQRGHRRQRRPRLSRVSAGGFFDCLWSSCNL